MNSLYDLLLNRPLPLEAVRGLLFGVFTLHFVFVLFTLGTAVLALFYFVQAHWLKNASAAGWSEQILGTFIAHKSLAVVLGVAPLLLIQIAFTLSFFTAINILAPFWLSVILLLIFSFLSFDGMEKSKGRNRYVRLAAGILGLLFLLAIPGVFVAALVTTENSAEWVAMIQNGYRLTQPLAIHWSARYLHVLGAGIVFGGVFHYLVSKKEEAARRATLIKWVLMGLVVQVILGTLLYISLPTSPDSITYVPLVVGIAAALVFLVYVYRRQALALKPASLLLLLILVPMLLTRQTIQDRGVLGVNAKFEEDARAYQAKLEPYHELNLARYQMRLDIVYDTGDTIYAQSCMFCHGPQADGQGIEAKNLLIPPEMISAVRTTRQHLYDRLGVGLPGSAMPYFAMFTRDQLDKVISLLDSRYQVLSAPSPVQAAVSPSATDQAQQTYNTVCSTCHGSDGRGNTAQAQALAPRPPDFTVYTLEPARLSQVISNGYPGTAMVGYATLSEEERWGLAKLIQTFYAPIPNRREWAPNPRF